MDTSIVYQTPQTYQGHVYRDKSKLFYISRYEYIKINFTWHLLVFLRSARTFALFFHILSTSKENWQKHNLYMLNRNHHQCPVPSICILSLVFVSCSWYLCPVPGIYVLFLVFMSCSWYLCPVPGICVLSLVFVSCPWYLCPVPGIYVLFLVVMSYSWYLFLVVIFMILNCRKNARILGTLIMV